MTRNYLQFPVVVAFTFPLLAALILSLLFHDSVRQDGAVADADMVWLVDDANAPEPALEPVRIRDARELKQMFTRLDYSWPPAPGPSVPRVAFDPLPDDFAWPDDIQHKKNMFFKVLMPLVLAENERILNQREALERAITRLEQDGPSASDDHPSVRVIARLAREYLIDGEPMDPALHQALLDRVDIIPVPLVLAQAANESGWGSSRFAREGNNLFGVWTFRPEKGIIPADRPEGESYAVRRYRNLQSSVRSHLFNLNIGHAYDDLRAMRRSMRERGEELDGVALAAGLERYSIRGQEYIDEIRAIIHYNDLHRVAQVNLRDSTPRIIIAAAAPQDFILQVAATRVD